MATLFNVSLEKKYPTLADKINMARQEGYNDAEIQEFIHGKMKDSLDEGYTMREITEHLKMPIPQGQDPSLIKIAGEREIRNFKKFLRSQGGQAEAAASMMTGLVNWIPAGLYYAYKHSPFSGEHGSTMIEEAYEREPTIKERTEKISEALTYKPKVFKKEAGEFIEPVQKVFELFPKYGKAVGEAVTEKTKSPLLGAAAQTVIEGAPFWLPVLIRAGWKVRPRGKAPIAEVPTKVKAPPELPAADIKEAYHGTADTYAQGIREKGFKLPTEEGGADPTYTYEPEGISLTTSKGVATKMADNVAEYAGTKPEVMKIDTSNLKIYDDSAGRWGGFEDYDAFIKDLKEKGYDAVKTANKAEEEVLVFNYDKIKVPEGMKEPVAKPEAKPPIQVKEKPIEQPMTESHPQNLNKFYEKSGKMIAVYLSLRAAAKGGEPELVKRIIKKYPKVQTIAPAMIQIRKKISELNQTIDQVIRNEKLTDDQKRKKIKELEVRRMKAAQSANKLM